MTLNRNIPPGIHSVDHVEYQKPERFNLNGGSELFVIKGGDQEVVKLDFAFKACSWYSSSKLESLMTAAMIQEGTSRLKAKEIANIFDFYGAQFNSHSHYDYNYVSLFSLKKHLPQLLPLIFEIISDSIFPGDEFEIIRKQRKQRAIIDAEKVGIISQRTFLRTLFSDNHPYAPIASPESYDFVTQEGTKAHFRRFYASDRMTIIASGHVDEGVIKLITDIFSGSWGEPVEEKSNTNRGKIAHSNQSIFIDKEGANQNAISIGKHFPTQNHPDYPAIRLLCTILGGYFGSRLMSNLREEKGLTYSIHASPISFVHNGVFLVSAEVKTQKTDEAVKEIFREMERLCKELITDNELSLVQNYMLGRILEDFDGPFARAQNFAALHEFGMDYEYFERLIHTVKEATSSEIREIARKYLSSDTMACVIAGTK
jgi:zinc protease